MQSQPVAARFPPDRIFGALRVRWLLVAALNVFSTRIALIVTVRAKTVVCGEGSKARVFRVRRLAPRPR